MAQLLSLEAGVGGCLEGVQFGGIVTQHVSKVVSSTSIPSKCAQNEHVGSKAEETVVPVDKMALNAWQAVGMAFAGSHTQEAPCLRCRRCLDHIDLGLWSLNKGGAGVRCAVGVRLMCMSILCQNTRRVKHSF